MNLLVGYPLLVTNVENYAKVHLSHHKYFFTEKDPDFLRKSGVDWTFPMTFFHFFKLFLSDLFGLTFIKLVRGKRIEQKDIFNRPYQYPQWIKPVYYLTIAMLLTYTNMWSIFFLYWLLPLLTVFPVIVRLGAITEHIYNLSEANLIESSPLILLSWWEKLLLPNLNFTLHIYHHYYPGVACFNLPKIHQIFKREQLVNEENVFYGYWAYLKYLQKSKISN